MQTNKFQDQRFVFLTVLVKIRGLVTNHFLSSITTENKFNKISKLDKKWISQREATLSKE